MRLEQLVRVARVVSSVAAAVAAAAAMWAAIAVGLPPLAVLVVLALLARVGLAGDRWVRAGSIGLVLAVAAVVGAAGGLSGPLLVALLLVVADLGLGGRPLPVAAVSTVAVALVVVTHLVVEGQTAVASDGVWPGLLVLLVGLVATRPDTRPGLDDIATLESATVALDEVVRIAERMPAGFDRWSVAAAVSDELRDACGRGGASDESPDRSPHLLLSFDGVLFGVDGVWSRQPVGLLADLPARRIGRTWRSVDGSQLPPRLREELGARRWLTHRLGSKVDQGVVLVPDALPEEQIEAAADVLRPAAVALANVDRFERLQELAISAAQVRLAHDLHDGIAQGLTHIRFELELLAMQHRAARKDLERVGAVADAVLLEVRRTVDELRETRPLVERIETHVRLVSAVAAADVELDTPPALDLDEAIAEDVFRVVQEALSNAIRHAQAELVRVAVTVHDDVLSVVVADDGIGIDGHTADGVGLPGMRSRARRLGGQVVVRPRHGGGTVMSLEVPLRGLTAASDPAGDREDQTVGTRSADAAGPS